MRHTTHTNESCHTYECVVSQTQVWLRYGQFKLGGQHPEAGQRVLDRALEAIPKRKHVKLISKVSCLCVFVCVCVCVLFICKNICLYRSIFVFFLVSRYRVYMYIYIYIYVYVYIYIYVCI